MGGFRTVSILRVLDFCDVADVLSHLAAQCNGQCLDATTNAEDGNLPVVGQLGNQQFRNVALAVDAP